MKQFDVAIVGAGPTGLACGIELKRRGLSPVLFDKGCVVNSIYHYPINLVFFTTPELLEIGDIPMTSLNEKPGRTEALKYYRRVADHYELDVHQYEKVLGFTGRMATFRVHTETSRGEQFEYAAKKMILASGYYDIPNHLNVPGEELPKVIHYYREAHPFYNHDVLLVGAKNSACIAALELFWTGARVTMVHRGARISRQREVLDQAEHRKSDQERRGEGLFSQHGKRDSPPRSRSPNTRRRAHAEKRFCVCHDGLPSGF